MDEVFNPIEKLYNILKTAEAQPVHANTLDVWASALGCSASNTTDIVVGLMSLMKLIEESKNAAQFIPGDKNRFLAPLTRVEQMLRKQNLTSPWQSSKAFLDSGTMTSLDFGVYAMTQFFPGASPEKSSELRDFVEKLDVLLEECLNSKLSDAMKALFIKHLEALRSALIGLRVSGVETLESTMDSIVGSIHRNAEAIKAQPDESKDFIQRFFDALGKANDLISAYQTSAPLLGQAAPLLLPLIHLAS
jgi:hypothetical protein